MKIKGEKLKMDNKTEVKWQGRGRITKIARGYDALRHLLTAEQWAYTLHADEDENKGTRYIDPTSKPDASAIQELHAQIVMMPGEFCYLQVTSSPDIKVVRRNGYDPNSNLGDRYTLLFQFRTTNGKTSYAQREGLFYTYLRFDRKNWLDQGIEFWMWNLENIETEKDFDMAHKKILDEIVSGSESRGDLVLCESTKDLGLAEAEHEIYETYGPGLFDERREYVKALKITPKVLESRKERYKVKSFRSLVRRIFNTPQRMYPQSSPLDDKTGWPRLASSEDVVQALAEARRVTDYEKFCAHSNPK